MLHRQIHARMLIGVLCPLVIGTSAYANDGEVPPPSTTDTMTVEMPERVIIDGREFGPEHGLSITVESFEIGNDGQPVGATYGDTPSQEDDIGPQAFWGSSYAYSIEHWQAYYTGVAKAAANIYNGQRIVQVCFWWSRGGNPVSSTTCSTASTPNGGQWVAGPEVQDWIWDSPNPFAPKTIFNMKTLRIHPAA